MKIKRFLMGMMTIMVIALSGLCLISCGDDDDDTRDKKELANNSDSNNGGNDNGDNNSGEKDDSGKIDVPQELLGGWSRTDPQTEILSVYYFNSDGTGKQYIGVESRRVDLETFETVAQSVKDFVYSYNRQNSTLTLFNSNYILAFQVNNIRMTLSIGNEVVMTFYKYYGDTPKIGQDSSTPTETLSTPTGVNASVDGSSILVSWQSVSGASSYNIYRSSSANGSYSLIGTASTTSYRDSSPISGKNYYKVSAVNSNGESSQSSYAYCEYSENSGPTTLSAPTNVRVANEGNNYAPSVIVRWDAVSGAQTYKVYKSSSANGSYSLMEEVNAYSTSCADFNPPTSGSRYYKVKAVNGSVESPFSSYAVYTPVNKDDAFAPSFSWGNCTVSGTNMTLRWTYNTGDHIGKPNEVQLGIWNPYSEEWQYSTLSTTATSTTFSFANRIDNDGWVKTAIIAKNAAGSAVHIKLYNYYTKEWTGN